MLVKELIEQLQELPKDSPLIITSMDDKFACGDFEVRSYHEDEETQEIILNVYIDSYSTGEEE